MSSSKRKACPPPAEGGLLKALYGGGLSFLMPVVSARWPSDLAGRFLDSPLSRGIIPGFIAKNNINMSESARQSFKSFNDFFTRELLPDCRPGRRNSLPETLISPADSRLTVYPIDGDCAFRVKYGTYSVASLLGDAQLAAQFAGGYCMVYRLSVDDYHRYCFFDSGRMGKQWRIEGRYYTVQPIALKTHDYFKENTRTCCLLETDNFGTAAVIEVGATFVGRIVNAQGVENFARGQEKGKFEFGGSTVIVLLRKEAAVIDDDILENSAAGLETRVRIGEKVGRKYDL